MNRMPLSSADGHDKGRPAYDPSVLLSFPLFRYGVLSVLFWTVAVGVFASWTLNQQSAYLLDIARQQARASFEKDLLVHRWSAALGEAYLPLEVEPLQSGGTSPNPSQIVTTTNGKKLARMTPAAVTRHLQALQQETLGIKGHLTSLTPGREANAPDEWERGALIRFNQGETEASTDTVIGGERYLRLMRPLVAEKPCLNCHGAKGYHLSDVLGGISIAIPLKETFSAQNEHRQRTLFAIGAIWLLGLGMIGAAFSRLRYQEQAREATAKALSDSEAEFRMLAENANDVIWTMDVSGRFSYVSPSVERQMGFTREEVLERGFRDMLSPVSLELARGKLQEAKNELARDRRILPDRLEVEQFRKDGSSVWFDMTLNPIYAPTGEFLTFMGVSRNITARKRTEAALKLSEEKYRSIFESFQDIYYRTDINGILTDITPSVAIWGGYSQEEALGRNVAGFYVNPEDRTKTLQQLQETGALYDFETQLITKDGKIVDASLTARLLFDSNGRPSGMEGVLRDITDRKRSEAKLKELSLKDELTGLNNRRGFMTLASQQMKGVERFKQFVALIYADLDKMKWINDNLGHQEGDRALVDTAQILKISFRTSDIIARLGGDEFVGMAVVKNEKDAELLMARLRESLELHNERGDRPYQLSISFGLALYDPNEPCPLTELMERADGIMYQMKLQRGSRRAEMATEATGRALGADR